MRILLILCIGVLISFENGAEGRSIDENEAVPENTGHNSENIGGFEQELGMRKRKECSNEFCNAKCKKNRFPVGRCTGGKCVCTGKRSKITGNNCL